jgi:hypothetical protein
VPIAALCLPATDMDVLLLFVLMAPVVIVLAVSRNRRIVRGIRSATVDLRVDEFGVSRRMADEREESVEWVDVTEVEVYRLDKGPHGAAGGLVMISGDETSGCLVPLDRIDDCGLIEGLQRLPGFRVESFVDALQAEVPSQLLVWRKDS